MFLFKSRKTIYLTRLHDTLGDDSCLDTFLAVGERESFSWLLLIFFALIWPNSWIPNRWFSSFLYCNFFLFPIKLIFDKFSDTFVDPTYEKSRVPLQFSSFLLKWALCKLLFITAQVGTSILFRLMFLSGFTESTFDAQFSV